MTESAEPPASDGPRRSASARRRPASRISAIGMIGELLVTAGVLVLLFLGWQTWWNSAVLAGQQTSAATKQGEEWLPPRHETVPRATSSPTPVAPPVEKAPAPAQPLAVIYVPRFGVHWKRIIRETVDVQSVLNSYDAGVGHYPGTAMPGQIGNFAIAAHDTGYGNTFIDVSKLRIGDAVYIQTPQGFYTYRFRNYEYVQPDAVDVLLPVPRRHGVAAKQRLITMTTCNPPYHAQERMAAYGVFESWQRTPPAAIAAEVGK
ncbi:MAG TPA: class E sortase [Humibacter sp.]|nr:class E sortase [Humibacter sp.]